MRVAPRVRVRVCECVRQERRLAWGVFLPSWKGTGHPSPVPRLSTGFLGVCFLRCDCTRRTRNPVSYKLPRFDIFVLLSRVEPFDASPSRFDPAHLCIPPPWRRMRRPCSGNYRKSHPARVVRPPATWILGNCYCWPDVSQLTCARSANACLCNWQYPNGRPDRTRCRYLVQPESGGSIFFAAWRSWWRVRSPLQKL